MTKLTTKFWRKIFKPDVTSIFKRIQRTRKSKLRFTQYIRNETTEEVFFLDFQLYQNRKDARCLTKISDLPGSSTSMLAGVKFLEKPVQVRWRRSERSLQELSSGALSRTSRQRWRGKMCHIVSENVPHVKIIDRYYEGSDLDKCIYKRTLSFWTMLSWMSQHPKAWYIVLFVDGAWGRSQEEYAERTWAAECISRTRRGFDQPKLLALFLKLHPGRFTRVRGGWCRIRG